MQLPYAFLSTVKPPRSPYTLASEPKKTGEGAVSKGAGGLYFFNGQLAGPQPGVAFFQPPPFRRDFPRAGSEQAFSFAKVLRSLPRSANSILDVALWRSQRVSIDTFQHDVAVGWTLLLLRTLCHVEIWQYFHMIFGNPALTGPDNRQMRWRGRISPPGTLSPDTLMAQHSDTLRIRTQDTQ